MANIKRFWIIRHNASLKGVFLSHGKALSFFNQNPIEGELTYIDIELPPDSKLTLESFVKTINVLL